MYFRLPFWLFYQVLYLVSFGRWYRAYVWDQVIWLPIWGLDRGLVRTAYESSDALSRTQFDNLMLEHRPLQRSLIQRRKHAALAGEWRRSPLDPQVLGAPLLIEGEDRLHPSNAWLRQLEATRGALMAACAHSNITLQIEAFEEFAEQLEQLREKTQRESPAWTEYYLKALAAWIEHAQARLRQLRGDRSLVQGVVENHYRAGEALIPGRNNAIFFGRKELKEQLAREILTSDEMPLFLLQGQRRVGKTSLLRFLSGLLGSGFQVVFLDCQRPFPKGVVGWMEALAEVVRQAYPAVPAESGQHINGQQQTLDALYKTDAKDWLAAWVLFLELLDQCLSDERKLIIALDEYESLHKLFRREPEKGEDLLGAIRSFLQHQKKVVFLFSGAAFLAELSEPHWSRYFVQTVRLPLDYLSREESLRLITEPVASALQYQPETPARLYELTQGHPALLQLICRKLVEIANRDDKRLLGDAELSEALGIIDRNTMPIEIFWTEFCDPSEHPHLRETVLQIMNGEELTDRPSVLRLREHGYIVEKEGKWQMRVPLFERWIRAYAELF